MKFNKGFTIIELIISLFILTVAIIGIYTAFYAIVLQTNNVSSRFTASYLAGEGLEIIRNIRDNNWVKSASSLDYVSWDDSLLSCTNGCQVDYKTGIDGQAFNLSAYGSGNYLYVNNNGFYDYEITDATKTKFRRKITITQVATDTLNVVVTVYWANGQAGEAEVSAEEYLYNWY